MKSNSPLAYILAVASLAAVLPAVVYGISSFRISHDLDLLIIRIFSIVGMVAATAIVSFSRKIRLYYGVLAAQMILAVCWALLFDSFSIAFVATFIIIEVAFFEPFPRSFIILTGTTILLVAVSLATLSATKEPRQVMFDDYAVFVPLLALALLGPFITKYREMIARAFEERERLANSVVLLTRANSQYQEYALNATELATEKERLRITREIHDIVGYTLTNNIMMLEAALRIMEENVLALPSIIETARSNAKEGLQRIRSSLYKLRLAEAEYPSGIKAINRLVRMFEQATGVHVRCETGNLPWSISEDVDSMLYHLVQESLVNSFLHGRATEVVITFWYDDDEIRIKVSDNGIGATTISEGIGLSGMKERISAVKGTLTVNYAPGSFTVYAVVPCPGDRYAKNANNHS